MSSKQFLQLIGVGRRGGGGGSGRGSGRCTPLSLLSCRARIGNDVFSKAASEFWRGREFSSLQRLASRRSRVSFSQKTRLAGSLGCDDTVWRSAAAATASGPFSDGSWGNVHLVKQRRQQQQLLVVRASSSGSLRKQSSGGSKAKVHFVCENCGETFSQWWGSCQNCKEMNTLREFREPVTASGPRGGAAARALERMNLTKREEEVSLGGEDSRVRKGAWLKGDSLGPQRLSDVVKGYSQQHWRLSLPGESGAEVARVLGGGIVPGSLILVGGDPGVGKSTLLLQVAGLLALGSDREKPAPVLYISGEESVEQISNRADRMQVGAHELFLYSATDLELVLEAIHELKPRAVVVDSIQTVYLPEATGSAGSVIQVRECAAAMLRLAKQTNIPMFLVGHVTKTGDIAGPRVLEHIVDVVLYMEGERLQSHRLLRVVKNRYGSSDEVGVFEMVEGGLQAITNPSALFLSERAADSSVTAAAAVAVTMEGSRPILLEVQALCSSSGNQQMGRRTANGVDNQRLYLLLAVLIKQAGLKLQNQDVFVNVVGGLQLREPASDVAIAIAISSSFLEKPVPRDMAFIGEIGLGGEIRSVGQLDRRITEAAKLGFKSCIVPRSSGRSARSTAKNDILVIPCAGLRDVLKQALGLSK